MVFNIFLSVNSALRIFAVFLLQLGVTVPCSVPEPIGKGRSQSMIEYQRSNSLQSRSNPSNAIGQYANSLTGSEVRV